MIFDTHVHSKYSTDSNTEPADAVTDAKAKGLGIIFTEHYDADYAENDYDFRVIPDDYLKACAKYRADDVLLGIEIGLTEKSREFNKNLADSYPFDFCVGSVHMVGDTDIYIDFVKSFGKNGRSAPLITGEAYFDYVIKMTEENDFLDALGHIDYPHRYLVGVRADFSFDTHKERYGRIFKNLIERDISIEINSRRLSSEETCAEMAQIYKRFRELGGKFATIGSDAHSTYEIGRNFETALRLARECELIPVYYKERKRLKM